MKQLLTDILTRINDLVPAIKYVDEDWGQLDYYSPNQPVKWPAALIDVNTATFSNTGNLGQIGTVTVRVRLADIKLTNTSANAPEMQKQKAFEIFDTLQALHQAIHGWTGSEDYTGLIRQSMRRQLREDGVRIYEVIYITKMKDFSTAPPKIMFKIEGLDVGMETI
jgi:hypothetical protein